MFLSIVSTYYQLLDSLHSFLGLIGYYRTFIPDFATLSASLTELTKKGVRFFWTPQHENAFLALKWHSCTAPVLAGPKSAQPFIIQTNASNLGLGTVLAQHDIHGTERVIAYASCTLSH